jgi:hypothetical protein
LEVPQRHLNIFRYQSVLAVLWREGREKGVTATIKPLSLLLNFGAKGLEITSQRRGVFYLKRNNSLISCLSSLKNY